MKKKGIIILIISVILVLLIIGGTTTAIVVSNQQVNNNIIIPDIDDDQVFEYDGEEHQPKIKNLDEDELKKVVFSYAEKKDDSPEDEMYQSGLPKNAGIYFVKVDYEDNTQFKTMTINHVEITPQEDVSVIYNQQDIIYTNYFTSLMDVSKIEFNSYFTNPNKEKVEGKVTLDVDKLEPSVSTYAYTFTPNDSNYMSYHGEVDIIVYARVSVLDEAGNQLDYDEVEYNSLFKYVPTKNDGYDMPILKDKDGNIYNTETRITSDVVLTQTEKLTDYTITYHLDDGQNDNDNPLTYTKVDETIVLKNPTKEGYSFDGWFTTEGFDAESRVEEIYPDRLMNYDLYAKFTFIKLIPIEITPLNRTYDGQPHELISVVQNGGEVYYSLNSTNYSNEIPTATDAGTYTIWYKVVGDDTYLDVAPTQIEVTISKATYDMSAVAFEDATITYDGQPHSINYTGTLPSGVTVDIQGQGTNVGEYQITAVFTGDSNNYEAIPNLDATLTITKKNPEVVAPLSKDLVYTGEAQELVTAGTIDIGTIQYSLDHVNYSETIPTATNPGTYTVYFKYVVDTNNCNSVPGGNVVVTLSKATYDMSAVVFADTTVVYDGASHTIEATNVPDGIVVAYTGSGTNAGTYTITAAFTVDTVNYEAIDSMTATLTIQKADLVVTLPTAKTGLVYDGTAQALVNAGSVVPGTIKYSIDGMNFDTVLPTGTNAGTYNVSYKFEYDTTNYNDVEDGSIEVVIANATPTLIAPTIIDNLTYTGSTQELVTAGSAIGGTLLYSLDDSDYKTDIPAGLNAGIYTVYYKVVGADNYDSIAVATLSITITKADVTFTEPQAITNLVYDGNAHALVTEGSSNTSATVEYKLNDGTYQPIVPTGKNAGSYTVSYRLTIDTTNYDVTGLTLSNDIVVTIATATPTYVNPTAKPLTYTGSAQELINIGTITPGSIEYSIDNTNWSTTIPTGTNAGLYTVYYRFNVTNSNYSQVAGGSVAVTIQKATATKTNPSAKTLTYTGSAQALVNAGTITPGTIEYSIDNTNWSTTIPTGTNAGTYTVYYRFIITNSNYSSVDGGSVAVTIKQAIATNTNPTAKDLIYTGSVQELVTEGSVTPGTIEYSIDNTNWSTAIPSGTNAGSYTVYYRFNVNSNYSPVSGGNVVVTIKQATPTYTVPTGITATPGMTLSDISLPSGFTFNSPLSTSVGSVGDNTFTITYTPTDTVNYKTITNIQVLIHVSSNDRLIIESTNNQSTTYNTSAQGPLVTVKAGGSTIISGYTLSYQYKLSGSSSYTSGLPTNAGTYSIKIDCTGDGYDAAITVEVTFVINKATLTVSTNQVDLNYDSASRTWELVSSFIANSITVTGFLGSDTGNVVVNGMHNGQYKYGTVSGSSIEPSSDTIFYESSNVIGSTYLAYFSITNSNYQLSKENVLVKYKTAKISSTYYTIEDALATSGTTTITFAGDSSGTATYVATVFSSLDTSITGYSNTYTISGRTIIVPYDNNVTSYTVSQTTKTGNVYSALVIPSHISLSFTNSAKFIAAALIGYSQPNSTISCQRGVIVNDGTISMANGCELDGYGYIKGNGNIELASGSTAIDCMHTYDWPGGNTANSVKSTILPVNAWSLHNISCEIKINHGATYKGEFYAVASESNVETQVIIIASSGTTLFRSSSGYVMKKTIKADSWSETHGNTLALRRINGSNQINGQKDILELYGSYIDNALSISVSALSISTSTSIACPISFMNIFVKNGAQLTLSKADYLFLPGTKLVIDEGGTLVTNSNVDLAFEKMANVQKATYHTSSYAFDKYCVDRVDAFMECNGSFTCKGNLGGIIKTTSLTGVLNLSSATLTSTHISLMNAVGQAASSSQNCAYKISGLPAQGMINNDSTYYQFTKSTYTSQMLNNVYCWNGTQGTQSPGDGTYSDTCSVSGSCFIAGTLITLADGSQKKIEDLLVTDQIMIFNHETGCFEAGSVGAIVNHGYSMNDVITLTFSDGTTLKITNSHGLFDINLNQYVDINSTTYSNYINHKFIKYDDITNKPIEVQLVNATLTTEYVESWSLFSAVHLNHVINSMLGITSGLPGFYNFYEFGENYTYDNESMINDIATYGQYTYDDWSDYITYDIFVAFNFANVKANVEKGYASKEQIIGFIQWFYELIGSDSMWINN